MPVIEIKSLDVAGVDVYSSLTERELRENSDSTGIFIAESPKVIKTALDSGYEAISLLCERKHIRGDAAFILESYPDLTIYTGSREILSQLTGYKLTRGVLCAMKRKQLKGAEFICKGASRIAVIESVCDTTNIGSIFRSAAALGIDGILLTPDSCDPFNRRSIRVSMGAVFKIPFTFVRKPVEFLNNYGFVTIALALHKDALPLDSNIFKNQEKLALVLGTEGDGLTDAIIEECKYKAIIPMFHGVDSLNVGAAAAVAFWQFRVKEENYSERSS